MSRTINVSTATFAAIWGNRKEGEETEDIILQRILGCTTSEIAPPTSGRTGFADARNGVTFPEGFEIFRVYKGREYRATATGGVWRRADNGRTFTSLNQLNGSIADGNENVWNGNWKYTADDGRQRSINDLR